MPTDSDPEDAPAPRVNLLRCLVCGNKMECEPADLLRFTQTKWPRCCGQVMPLFMTTDKPDPPAQEPPKQ
jgi:hypothetical protein